MESIAKVFDYMKRAFHLNRENRGLYKPQVVLILIKTAFFIFTGIFLYKVIFHIGGDPFFIKDIWTLLIGAIGFAAGIILLLGIVGVLVESGLYNMYKACILSGRLTVGVFGDGVRKYFLRFLLADLLMVLVWILLLVPYLFLGALTLMAGYVIIPLLVAIFTAMWKVNMVMEEARVIEGLRASLRYAREHFWPLAFLIVIRSAFSAAPYGAGGGSGGSGGGSGNVQFGPVRDKMPFGAIYRRALPYVKAAFLVLIPVVGLAVFIGSLVKMVFEVFFSLCIFILYDETENKDEPNEDMGGEAHVVR